VSGFLVPPEDPDALSAAILQLLSDPSKARTMAQRKKSGGRKIYD